jgi:hypothetical protein
MGAFNLTTTRFAHLLGPLARSAAGARAARAEDDNEDDDKALARDDGDDEDEARAADAEDSDRTRKAKRSKKARAEDDDTNDEDDADNEDDARAADDDTDDEENKDDAKGKHGRHGERARCAQIFRCAGAGRRPDVAAHLAFDTGMRAADAVALLNAIASGDGARADRADTLRARMAGVSLPAIGSDGGTAEDRDGPQAAASMILAAARRARGEA